jgi:4-hydroxybenzoyl-CoA reductase subunit alpha
MATNPGTTNTRKRAVVGRAQTKIDSRDKVRGLTKYADDLTFPRMLYAKILRSSVPHANIRSIDISAAEKLPGVKAVLTGEKLPLKYGMMPVAQDEHVLAFEKVRMVGDPVVAVAATSEEIAEEAIQLIKIEYELLPAIASIQEALDNPDTQIHSTSERGNIHRSIAYDFGDVEKGFAEADHVREDIFFYEGNTHLAMEEHASIGVWSPDQKLTLYSSTQNPHYLHRIMSRVLGLEQARVRVIAMPCGGGFGGKCDPFNHEIAVCKLSMMTGRPVKITLTREEVFYCHRGRHPVLMSMKIGYKNDGTITAFHNRTVADGGAYGGHGPASMLYTGVLQTTTYKLGRYKFQGARVNTNKAPCGPKRGHGTPQPRFGQEVQLDKIATHLGIDPADLRKKIMVEPESLTENWLPIHTIGLSKCIDKVIAGSGWKTRRGNLPYGRGLGLACSAYMTGAGTAIYWNSMPHSGVQVKLDRSGGVAVFCGVTDIGQGSNSMLAYITAEILGIDPFDIRVVSSDTDITPVDLGSYSSRVTLMAGNACVQAVERAKKLIVDAVAPKLEIPAERVVFADHRVYDEADPSKSMSFAEAVQLAETQFGTLGTTGSYKPPKWPGKYRGAGVGPAPAYSYCASVVEVDVNPYTGIVTVPKIWIAHDGGTSLNPTLVMGQVEGSVYMGLSEVLMEEMTYRGNRNVVHKFPSMLEYKSPTSADMPEIISYLLEDPEPNGPFGAKEAGQGPLLPIPPAVANAVFNAVGVRMDEVPITPEKVLRGLRLKQKGQDPRVGPTRFPEVPYPDPIVVATPDDRDHVVPTGKEPVGAKK